MMYSYWMLFKDQDVAVAGSASHSVQNYLLSCIDFDGVLLKHPDAFSQKAKDTYDIDCYSTSTRMN